MKDEEKKRLVDEYVGNCTVDEETSLIGLVAFLDKSGLFKTRKQTIKEIWDFLKDYEWTESLKTLFRLKYGIKEKTKEAEFKERIAEEIIDKIEDMVGGELIAQALREIYLEEEEV